MPNREFSRSREAENQKFDQTQRDASSWNIYDRQKGIMTPEMATREQLENIQQVIKRRGEITSEGAEVRLGFDAKVRGGMESRDFTTHEEDKHYDTADSDDDSIWTNRQRRAVSIRKRARKLIADGWSKDYIRSDINEYREQLRKELPSDDEASPSRAHDEAGPSYERETFEKSAIDFLTEEEKQLFRQASKDSDDWTYKERRACRLYTHVYDLKGKGHSDAAIASGLDDSRREIREEVPSPHQSNHDSDSGYGQPPSYPYYFQQDGGYGQPPSYPYHFQQDGGYGQPDQADHSHQGDQNRRTKDIHDLVDQIYYSSITRSDYYTPHRKYMKKNMLNETEYRTAIAYLDSQYNTQRGTHNERTRIIDILRRYRQK